MKSELSKSYSVDKYIATVLIFLVSNALLDYLMASLISKIVLNTIILILGSMLLYNQLKSEALKERKLLLNIFVLVFILSLVLGMYLNKLL